MALTLMNNYRKPQIWGEVVTITPESAEQLLAANANFNRKVNVARVNKYAEIMANGGWALTPEGLIIDANTDKLIQGQHRLHAIIKSGVTLPMYVAYTTESDTYKFLDQGKNRDFSDISGKEKKITTTVHQALRLIDPKRKGVTYVEAEPYLFGRLGQEVEQLHNVVNPRGRIWNNTTLKVMAVSSIITGTMSRQDVYSLYKKFILVDTAGLSGCRVNFMRQVMNNDVASNYALEPSIISKGYNLFSESGNDMVVCRYSQVSYDKGMQMVRDAVAVGK